MATLVVGLVLAGVWPATGGRWMVVVTPSMGQAAPVGTLVLTRPVSVQQLQVGDIVSYHSPTPGHRTYTHRVVALTADGGFRTRGDVNIALDPWVLHQRDLIGRVAYRLWGLGWVVHGLPLFLVGVVVLWLVTRVVSARWRSPLRVLGASSCAAIVLSAVHPFGRVVVMSTTAGASGAQARLVSTGLLPLRVTARHGTHVDLVDGQVGTVTAPLIRHDGQASYPLDTATHMSWVWWAIIVALCLSPLLYGLAVGFPPPDEADSHPGPPHDPHHVPRHRTARVGRRRPLGISAVLLASILAGAALGASTLTPASSTRAAFTAKIGNTANSAGTNPYFTCQAAAVADSTYWVYPLTDTTFVYAADTSGYGLTAYYEGGTFTHATGQGCARDAAGYVTLAGSDPYILRPGPVVAVSTFSIEVWFKTSTAGGRIDGFGTSYTTTSPTTDRQIYMDNAGHLDFGIHTGTFQVITSPGSYADGRWHQAVVTIASSGGCLYVDGALVANSASMNAPAALSGYWRIGYDTLAGWPNAPSNFAFQGSLAFDSGYTYALSSAQVLAHYRAGV